MLKSIYVAATSQHVGKTTSTLGLVAMLKQAGINVGYCKPVGQQFKEVYNGRVDKDALLFSTVMDFELEPEIHSPVILGGGVTAQFIDNPDKFNFEEMLQNAADELHGRHDIVVYEGTGHPGVGSVVDLSNADVAKMLGSGVIMIVEAGIGSTIDELNLCVSMFKTQNVPILGVIVNKVYPDKIEKIRHYVGTKLERMGLRLIGVLPYDKSLMNPLMFSIKNAVKGVVITNGHKLNNRVEDIIAGSLVDMEEFSQFHNILLVVSQIRLQDAIVKINSIAKSLKIEGSPLSGIVITGDGKHAISSLDLGACKEYVIEHEIPVITTILDTYGAAVKISRIEVKINTKTPWKTKRAIELISENVDLQGILNK